jgi:hypothetical protein
LAAVRKASGCGNENIIVTWETCHNGKRHIEVLPINESVKLRRRLRRNFLSQGLMLFCFRLLRLPFGSRHMNGKKRKRPGITTGFFIL